MALADAGLAGIATADGGPTSHVAIIAAGLGLPMLAALGPALALIADGTAADPRRRHADAIAPDANSLDRARAAAAAARNAPRKRRGAGA